MSQKEGVFAVFICTNCSVIFEYDRDPDVDNCSTASVSINDRGRYLISCDSGTSFKTGDSMASSVVSISVVPINSAKTDILFVLIFPVVPGTVPKILDEIGSFVIFAANILLIVWPLSDSVSR